MTVWWCDPTLQIFIVKLGSYIADIKGCSANLPLSAWYVLNFNSKYDLFQPKTDFFSTRTLISVHFKTVRYFSQSIFSLFSYFKNA